MRDIPEEFSGGAMTLAHCWRLTRQDGTILGFTDHDADLQFDGIVYAAKTGASAADLTHASGFEVSGGEISGALNSLGLTDVDIAAGAYDNARLELFLVDWTKPDIHLLLTTGMIGEIKRHGGEFIAELRSLASLYQEDKGRLYQRSCSADLGDQQCRINLADSRFHIASTIAMTNGASYLECDIDRTMFDFTNGLVTFSSGRNSGKAISIKFHNALGDRSALWLWHDAPYAMQIGDAVMLTVGCDKSFATCKTRFANQDNFRGFPHMPGNDFIVSIAKNGDPQLNGGSLFND